jgi:exodeoxyribonuclease X
MPTDPQSPLRQLSVFDERNWAHLRWAVVDVEGNGQHPDPDLVEVAVVQVIDGQIGTVRSWLVRPPRPVTWQAHRVHGLTTTDLAAAPTADTIAPDVVEALQGAEVVVGHQVRVDLAVLTRCLPGWPALPAVDTLRLSRALHPDLPSHRLGALGEHFDLTDSLPGPAHRAGYDATLTARLLVHLAAGLTPGTARRLTETGRVPLRASRGRSGRAGG